MIRYLKATGVGAAVGVVLWLLFLAGLFLVPVVSSHASPSVTRRGDLETSPVSGDGPFTVEVDACPTRDCETPRPFFGASDLGSSSGRLRLNADTLDRRGAAFDSGAFYRYRVFDAQGNLTQQSSVERIGWLLPANPFAWSSPWLLLTIPLGAGSSLVWARIRRPSGARPVPSAPREVAPSPRLAPAPVTAPAPVAWAPAPTPTAPPLTAPQRLQVIVCDAETKLPVSTVRFQLDGNEEPLRQGAAAGPGAFFVEVPSGAAVLARSPGYASRRLSFVDLQSVIQLSREEEGFRVRVVGKTSGRPLGGIPVRWERDDQVLREGRTDEAGTCEWFDAKPEDKDLFRTTLQTEGFQDAAARYRDARETGLVELAVNYGWSPNAAQRARIKKQDAAWAVRFQQAAELDPDVASLMRALADPLMEWRKAYETWGGYLIAGPWSPVRYHEGLLEWEGRLEAQLGALLGERVVVDFFRRTKPRANPTAVQSREEAENAGALLRASADPFTEAWRDLLRRLESVGRDLPRLGPAGAVVFPHALWKVFVELYKQAPKQRPEQAACAAVLRVGLDVLERLLADAGWRQRFQSGST